MGLFNLSRFCTAVFFTAALVPALAADPPVPRGNVSANVNPTTGYYSSTNSTLRLPNGVSVTPRTDITPVVSKYSGGLQQTIPTGITIDAIKKSAPLPAVVRSTTQSVKSGATRCLSSGRCNVALILAGEGLSRLLDGLDWVMGEGATVMRSDITMPPDQLTSYCLTMERSAFPIYAPNGSIHTIHQSDSGPASCPAGQQFVNNCTNSSLGYYWNFNAWPNECRTLPDQPKPPPVPVSSDDIASGVDSNYEPEPSDWPALTPELELDDVEITSAPTLQGEPKTTTVYDANGNPLSVTETNTWFDFDVRDNPSKQPAVDLKTRTETKTYENGDLTGTTTTESTDSAGSGGAQAPELDIPTDCDFHPTLCAWMDWTQQNDLDDEPDLSQIMHEFEPTNTNFSVTGSKSCPAPYSIHIGLVNRTYELSFEPACTFAGYLYFLVMAGAYIFAAYITLGVARNG